MQQDLREPSEKRGTRDVKMRSGRLVPLREAPQGGKFVPGHLAMGPPVGTACAHGIGAKRQGCRPPKRMQLPQCDQAQVGAGMRGVRDFPKICLRPVPTPKLYDVAPVPVQVRNLPNSASPAPVMKPERQSRMACQSNLETTGCCRGGRTPNVLAEPAGAGQWRAEPRVPHVPVPNETLIPRPITTPRHAWPWPHQA